jgi:SH3-like domain-containing protein
MMLLLFYPMQASAEMKSVRVKTANFREAPADDADILFTADRYYPVKIVERKSGWAKVRDFEGEVAWVAERLLNREKTVVIRVEYAIARDKPETSGKQVFRASWSDAFLVKEVRTGWVSIEGPDGKEAWVLQEATWGLEPKGP